MGRRGNGEGTLFKNQKGRWVARITIGYDSQGRQKFKSCNRKTRREASDWLQAQLVKRPKTGQEYTLIGFIAYFLEQKKTIRESTRASYKWVISHIEGDFIAKKRMCDITAFHIVSFYERLAEKQLSRSSYITIHVFLSSCFDYASAFGVVSGNMVKYCAIPQGKETKKRQAWTREQASEFLHVVKEHRLYALFYILLSLGLRIGEALALMWEDVDLKAKTLTIDKALVKRKVGKPKTESSYRTLYLCDKQIDVLLAHKELQSLERSAFATKNQGILFASTRGTYLIGRNVQKVVDAVCEKAGIERRCLHEMRHTYVSLARESGLDAEIIAAVVGHSRVQTTLNVYRHVYQSELAALAKSNVLEVA